MHTSAHEDNGRSTDARQLARDAIPGFAARCAALRPHLTPGLDYIRRVRDSYERIFWSWDTEGVGANLVEAEIAAHLRPETDWPDRFQPSTYLSAPSQPSPEPGATT